ncbi:GOLPH3/VPS74 family protein [Streptomyces gibsoniae]|uniref:GPP34 family phosphoprotein n=1 Tax=Streptomyces gibsoniae TaxID=3075529 RepID=A0ABU2TQZ5_9ACTN|nr:GPP34 family phosphoprotein [Streptomyces sp. DSM 41699]MDT0463368.1 GPP34 family phosphoprotein [Streptomyces sp. DSM 41699]
MSDGSPSLPARLYLLAWDTTRRRLRHDPGLAPLVRAGALTELAGRGLLVDADGVATPRDLDAHSGDAVLDGLLELVMESGPRSWESWVTRYAAVTLDAVRPQLAAAGFLRADSRRGLGLLRPVEYTLERVQAVEALQREARQTLTGPEPVAEVLEEDAALVALAAAAGLSTVTSPAARERHRERIEALTARGSRAVPVLPRVVLGVRRAVSGPDAAAPPARTGG